MSGAFPGAWAYYKDRRETDAAFELAEKLGAPADIDRLMIESMDELLNGARLPTLESWVDRASARVGESPSVLLAQAEVALRQGRHLIAQSIAERITRGASGEVPVAFRAYLLGGRAAHVGSREDDALALYREAERVACAKGERRLAKWGQLTAAAAPSSMWLTSFSASFKPRQQKDSIRPSWFEPPTSDSPSVSTSVASRACPRRNVSPSSWRRCPILSSDARSDRHSHARSTSPRSTPPRCRLRRS